MKTSKIILLCFIFISCSKSINTKHWIATIKIQEQELKTIIKIDEKESYLINSDEKIPLTKKENNLYQIGANYSSLKLNFKEENGLWIRENKEDYQVPLSLEKTELKDLFKDQETKICKVDIAGKWKVQLSSSKIGLGVFEQIGCRTKGSILTTTGDYRYLDGFIKDNKLLLQGFDGVFAFVFKLTINANTLKGMMYAGKSYQTDISATKDDNFTLADATGLTQIREHKAINLKMNDIQGNLVDLDSDQYKDKVKVIQLFGSWCPNCLDETRFINRWQQENPDLNKKVAFIALAFEDFKTKKEALKALKKSKTKLRMNYPLILADYNKSLSASDILPIDKVRAYPTTLFLDKKNKVIKVHTGFSGQATGPFFDEFVKDFTKTLSELAN